jgi:hypothetical protein
MTTFRTLRIALVATSLTADRVAASQTTIKLDRPTATLSEVFSVVNDVVELAPDRVLVADEKERRLTLVELAGGRARDIGRLGAGPGEFRSIGRLFERRGGAWLADFAQRRLLPVNADGTFGTPVAYPVSIMLAAADDRGALYGDGFMPNMRERSDSMYMLRWTPETGRVDTLGKYDAGVTKWTGQMTVFNAYPFQDTWTPLSDGTAAIVFSRNYGVGLLRDGNLGARRMLPYEARRISEADKEALRRKMAAEPVRTIGGGNPNAAPRPRPPIEFREVLPPFGGDGLGGSYARRARNGDVWITRLRTERDSVQYYDVIDAIQGKLLWRVELTPRATVVGFGDRSVYVAERGVDDVVSVRRHGYPGSR